VALHEIRILGDDVLRKPAQDVEVFDDDLVTLVSDMMETMYHAEGIGLAAPQIGLSKRLVVIDIRVDADENTFTPIALVNPRIAEMSADTEKSVEGCLSIPEMEEIVERAYGVRVEALSPRGEALTVEAEGLLARALQHEIDHLDGVLFIDRISPLKRKMLLRKWRKALEE
jgi:peptide deformylase